MKKILALIVVLCLSAFAVKPNMEITLNCKASGLAKANGTWQVEAYINDGEIMNAAGHSEYSLTFALEHDGTPLVWLGSSCGGGWCYDWGNDAVDSRWSSYDWDNRKEIVTISNYSNWGFGTFKFSNTCSVTLTPITK